MFYSYCLLLLSLLCHNISQSMQPDITYRVAELNDVPAILKLYETTGEQEADKIVVLPKLFRQENIKKNIEKKRLYGAYCSDQLIGLKKTFVMNGQEKEDILQQEIRLNNPSFNPDNCIMIYNGGDLTHKDFRGKGINKNLTNYSLNIHIERIKPYLKDHSFLALVYGLTKFNAGEQGGSNRTDSIKVSFEVFLQQLNIKHDTIKLEMYPSFKPSFDPDAQECKPLDDNKSIPGYGCVLFTAYKNSELS